MYRIATAFGVVAIIGAGSVASMTVPIVPQETTWVRSYETTRFATDDGDLALNEYAQKFTGEETIYYVRNVPKNRGPWVATTTKPVGKTRVAIYAEKSQRNPKCIGCAYYSEFRRANGQIIRRAYNKKDYDGGRTKPAYPQPVYIERAPLLVPRVAEAAIAYDAVSNDTAGGTDASSISWSHTAAAASDTYIVIFCIQDNDWQSFTATYDGGTATELFEVKSGGGTDDMGSMMAYDSVPDTSANTVACTSNETDPLNGVAVTYTGVDTVDATSATSAGGDSSSEPTAQTVTTVSGSMAVMYCGVETDRQSFNGPGSGQTNRFDDDTFTKYSQGAIFEEETATGASTIMTCDTDDAFTAQWVIGAVELEAAGGSPPASRRIIRSVPQ